jgi:hypothetical protein
MSSDLYQKVIRVRRAYSEAALNSTVVTVRVGELGAVLTALDLAEHRVIELLGEIRNLKKECNDDVHPLYGGEE